MLQPIGPSIPTFFFFTPALVHSSSYLHFDLDDIYENIPSPDASFYMISHYTIAFHPTF
jgi:hypothetical protein